MPILRAIMSAVRRRPISSALFVLIIVWLAFVRVYNVLRLEPGYARISGLLESTRDLQSGTTAAELLEAKHFAAMSAEVYRLAHIADSKTDAAPCDLKKVLSGWTLLPHSADLPDKPSKDERSKASWDGDLVYGIWHRRLPSGKVQFALVFRGTHTWGDWWSNARWVTKHLNMGWDQYDLARRVATYVSKDLLDKKPELLGDGPPEIIAAGHSLGGGLAQQAGYASPAIRRVYSFNGSSVTGFYDVTEREKNKRGMRIYRISERGEVLALLRGLMKIVYPVVERDPKIVQASYNFGTLGLISQHSMDDLACALIEQD